MGDRLLRWLLFGVIIALIPFIARGVMCIYHKDAFDMSKLLSHGELLLVSVALSARGLGDVITEGAQPRKKRRMVVGGISAILIFLSTFFFADINAAWNGGGTPPNFDFHNVLAISICVYIATFICSGCAVILREDLS